MSAQSPPVPIKIPDKFRENTEVHTFMRELTRSAQMLREEVKPQAAVRKTSDYVTTFEDRGKVIEADGNITITIGAGESMKSGYGVTIKKVGSGDVTIDAQNGEMIDGVVAQVLTVPNSSISTEVNKDELSHKIKYNYDPTPIPTGLLASKDNIVNTDVDFNGWRGMSVPFIYDFGSTDSVSTSFTDVAGRSFMMYIPANMTTLYYQIELQGATGFTTSYARLRTSAANGSTVQTANNSFIFVVGGTLNVSSINNTNIEVFIQHRSDGTLANAKIRKVSIG